MLFGFVTLFVALALSTVAAYYSILGLTAIFSAAAIPVIIMGVALELGKINATVWLHKNWRRSPFLYKTYLVPAVAFLMLLTSMGIFGFLSKAHSDQSLVSGNSTAQLAIIDEKIKIQRENIDTARRALAQLDAQVNERLSRGTTEQGVERAATLRRQQTAERNRLLKDVNDAQTSIQKLNEERAPIAAEFRKVEAEVGPIKYIAALLYDDNVDQTILEKAVRWVIILIVVVFDPLALVLILAGTRHLEWVQEERRLKKLEQDSAPVLPPTEDPPVEPELKVEPEVAKEEPQEKVEPEVTKEEVKPEVPKEEPFDISKHPYLFNVPKLRTPPGIDPVGPIVARAEDFVPPPVENIVTPAELTANTNIKIDPVTGLPETNTPNKIKLDIPPEAMTPPQKARVEVAEAVDLKQKESTRLIADNDASEPAEVKAHFGIVFPVDPEKGEMYLRVDFLPSRLFKFNGNKWIEIEKQVTDTYLYNEEYIQYLVTEISAGRYDPDNLTERERQQVTDFLNNEQGNNTTRSS